MFGSNNTRPIDYHIRGKLFDPHKAFIESALIHIIVSTLVLSTTVKTDINYLTLLEYTVGLLSNQNYIAVSDTDT